MFSLRLLKRGLHTVPGSVQNAECPKTPSKEAPARDQREVCCVDGWSPRGKLFAAATLTEYIARQCRRDTRNGQALGNARWDFWGSRLTRRVGRDVAAYLEKGRSALDFMISWSSMSLYVYIKQEIIDALLFSCERRHITRGSTWLVLLTIQLGGHVLEERERCTLF